MPRCVKSILVSQLAWRNQIHHAGEPIPVVSRDFRPFHEQVAEGILGSEFQIDSAREPLE